MSTPREIGTGARLKWIREQRGMTQTEIAKALGLSLVGYQRYERAERDFPIELMPVIHQRMGVNPHWLVTGQGDPFVDEKHKPIHLRSGGSGTAQKAGDSGLVSIPLLELRAAAGGGAIPEEYPDQRRIMEFSEIWLRTALRVNPKRVQLYVTQGDSMSPDINPGDLLIVDTSATEVLCDSTYVFEMDGGIFVKKLQRLPGDALRVVSVNPQYESYSLVGKKQSTIHVVGRVAFHGKLM